MNYHEYTEKMKEIQEKFLRFVEKEDNVEENYQNLISIISNQKIKDNFYELKSVLYMISKISSNHSRRPSFFEKIEQVLKYLNDLIQKNFTSFEIYKIFANNKMILLFLIQEKILVIDEYISKKMLRNRKIYSIEFFKPEVEQFIKNEFKSQNNEELPENFYEKRKIGENHNYICKLIREDLIEEFITFVKKNDYPLKSTIEPSIYETNVTLITKKVTLIDYAAFFGSVQIFKYLYLNGVELNRKLWIFAIHSDNPEMINLLEENKVIPYDISYEECLKEAVKCHHNDIANYIINNLLIEEIETENLQEKFDENLINYSFHYYNFLYFPNEMNNRFIIYNACRYDYFKIVELSFTTLHIDNRKKAISTFFRIQYNFKTNQFF